MTRWLMSRYVFIQSASRLIFLILSHPHALILLPTRVSTRLNRKNTGNTAPLILHLSIQPGKVIEVNQIDLRAAQGEWGHHPVHAIPGRA